MYFEQKEKQKIHWRRVKFPKLRKIKKVPSYKMVSGPNVDKSTDFYKK